MKAKKQKGKKAIKLKALSDQKMRAARAESDIMGAIAGKLVQLEERLAILERRKPDKGEKGDRGDKGGGFWG